MVYQKNTKLYFQLFIEFSWRFFFFFFFLEFATLHLNSSGLICLLAIFFSARFQFRFSLLIRTLSLVLTLVLHIIIKRYLSWLSELIVKISLIRLAIFIVEEHRFCLKIRHSWGRLIDNGFTGTVLPPAGRKRKCWRTFEENENFRNCVFSCRFRMFCTKRRYSYM